MVCAIHLQEKPNLNDPVLIEGLPGIGFVANIATLHLIHELKAKLFAQICSSSFQDLAVATETGGTRFPTNELYWYKSSNGGRDLILWYGSTQALTTFGQYELCGRVLDLVQKLGCSYLITLGGFKRENVATEPKLYCAASDPEALKEALDLGAETMVGQIFGVAGLLVGIGKIRGFRGFSLLAETPGLYPDANAARQVLSALCKLLNVKVDLSRLDLAAEKTNEILKSFGLVRSVAREKKKEEFQPRWFV
jgi:uncharacterized protein (TIGR00162 family)